MIFTMPLYFCDAGYYGQIQLLSDHITDLAVIRVHSFPAA